MLWGISVEKKVKVLFIIPAHEGNDCLEDAINNIKKFNFNSSFKKNTWKKREVVYCNNCGKYGHIYKKCFDPITSYGIICMDLNNPAINKFFLTKVCTIQKNVFT